MVVESVAFPEAVAGGPDGTVEDSDVLILYQKRILGWLLNCCESI